VYECCPRAFFLPCNVILHPLICMACLHRSVLHLTKVMICSGTARQLAVDYPGIILLLIPYLIAALTMWVAPRKAEVRATITSEWLEGQQYGMQRATITSARGQLLCRLHDQLMQFMLCALCFKPPPLTLSLPQLRACSC